ncbi:peptidylprolyl isomerase [Acetobacter cibinongensis]|uniref:Parvulin-like PPIase n=1 Tax=Acetobacter cibinongensis TaxID=146475 RepID=A0A0D6N636_9PROT|nr:peptidyl-prolyl cis-trans isomerase [Acetobacter cibinongensis]GAN61170.1 peptidyl-prolyl cis-trans isomerase [Acetobacter cibinongensis]GBQ17422.1 peptidyl-prolyl cis-trans isomerase [Acetobacter cibinongensis NRIC 0482]GEL57936.1 peptidylprolyl isomerase [Acetobacter cibinongensis]
MISYLRHVFVDSWLGRVIAIVLFLAFIGWGIGDVVNYMGTETDVVAKVGNGRIGSDDLAQAIQSELPNMAKQMGVSDASQLPPALRKQVAYQVLQRLIGQEEVLEAAHRLGISVPDSAVRDEVFSLPYFKGPTGQFDRTILNARLRERGMNEQHFLTLIRDDLTSRTVLQPVAQGGTSSALMARRLSAFGLQTRVVDLVRVPFSEQATPPTPSDAVLQRYYANHPWMFQAPEFRHARIVVLSPATAAQTITVDDKDLKRVYDEESSRYNVPETRDVQVVTLPDEEAARKTAALWQGGADWNAVQAASKGGASVDMPGTRASGIPSEILSKAVFAAPLTQVQGPVKTEAGWTVFRVNKITAPSTTPFEVAKQDILQQYRTAKAPSIVAERSRQLQDAIAGSGLDSIPADIGAVAAAGTMDANGNTQDKEPAPLPASGKLREALLQKVFSLPKGNQPNLIEGPDNSWFAVQVDAITPAAPRSFELAKADVLAAWQAEARKHAADLRATAIYTAAKDHGGIAQTASAAQSVKDLSFSRSAPNKNIPSELMGYLPQMQAGQSVMAQDDTSFLIATVTKVYTPDPLADPVAFQRVRDALTQSEGDDLVASYVDALAKRFPPKITERAVTATLSSLGFDGTSSP